MTDNRRMAPGAPGIEPRWTSSAKSGVGSAPTGSSHVWFTLSHGIFNEIYFPDVDMPCTRDMGLIVTDGAEFFSEEKRHTAHEIAHIAPGVPAFRLRNTCEHGRFRVDKHVLSSLRHDAVLQHTKFIPLKGELGDYHLYVLLSPHLGCRGSDNVAWIDDYKGTPMLFARRADYALALACSAPWLVRSAGFAGVSDGWQDLDAHRRLTWQYDVADAGNVALTGEIDLVACDGECLLVLGFGRDEAKAAFAARSALYHGFERAQSAYVHGWQQWQHALVINKAGMPGDPKVRGVSAAALRVHESKRFASAIIASLSIPWGFAKGDNDLGGYHLVWPRDLVEAAGGLLAAGATADAHRVLNYLAATQEGDGHWAQNMWLDGVPYWNGVQLDEAAFPILLVDLLQREDEMSLSDLERVWPIVRRAAAFIARCGPGTPQDRWEENAGLSPFTLSVEIAALLTAAQLAEQHGELDVARYLRETADGWNDDIERWTYAADTELARKLGIEGYYVRIAPVTAETAASPREGFVPIKMAPPDIDAESSMVVSPDALALVRFGLRAADDPRIVNTVRAIDAVLKRDLGYGPGWRRYTGDRYGEYDDGSPYDGGGVGRCWPLLTGERAHYELAAGRPERALDLLRIMEKSASSTGMIPEQAWDAPDIPDLELFKGRPAGSAMPLVWAHAEYIKLCRSIADGRVFDTPSLTAPRYVLQRTSSPFAAWRFNLKRRRMPPGKTLRIEVLAPATVHWSADGWATTADTPTQATGLGVFVADLPTERLGSGDSVVFTLFWPAEQRWEGVDYTVVVE